MGARDVTSCGGSRWLWVPRCGWHPTASMPAFLKPADLFSQHPGGWNPPLLLAGGNLGVTFP